MHSHIQADKLAGLQGYLTTGVPRLTTLLTET